MSLKWSYLSQVAAVVCLQLNRFLWLFFFRWALEQRSWTLRSGWWQLSREQQHLPQLSWPNFTSHDNLLPTFVPHRVSIKSGVSVVPTLQSSTGWLGAAPGTAAPLLDGSSKSVMLCCWAKWLPSIWFIQFVQIFLKVIHSLIKNC